MSEYTEVAEKFLSDTDTTFSIEFQYTGPYFASDQVKRDVYRFTLKNKRGEYSGTFGDSIHNTNQPRKHKPTAYDVLACLEKYEPGAFDDWAAEMGYNDQPLSEHPNVLKIWTACVEQYRSLSRMFSADEMEQLREIN